MRDHIAFLYPPLSTPSLKNHCLPCSACPHSFIHLANDSSLIDYYAASVYVLDTHSFPHYMLFVYHVLVISLLARLLCFVVTYFPSNSYHVIVPFMHRAPFIPAPKCQVFVPERDAVLIE